MLPANAGLCAGRFALGPTVQIVEHGAQCSVHLPSLNHEIHAVSLKKKLGQRQCAVNGGVQNNDFVQCRLWDQNVTGFSRSGRANIYTFFVAELKLYPTLPRCRGGDAFNEYFDQRRLFAPSKTTKSGQSSWLEPTSTKVSSSKFNRIPGRFFAVSFCGVEGSYLRRLTQVWSASCHAINA